MIHTQPLDTLFRGSLLFGILVTALCLEQLIPLRKVTRPKLRRIVTNLGLAAIGTLALKLTFFPFVIGISELSAANHWGLIPRFGLPTLIQLIVAIVALDYTLYIWHWLNHRVPFLWRFHNVHHVDLDLDVSTASRFHFGELILSAIFRSGQIVLLGIDPFTLILFETLITTFAQFHHSNIWLPLRLETLINKLLVTPRMHGIHHSIVQKETDSNYSAIFSVWDRLHRSMRLNIRQSQITIGVAAYRDPKEVTFVAVLLLPFQKQRPWKLPDGSNPTREVKDSFDSASPTQMMA